MSEKELEKLFRQRQKLLDKLQTGILRKVSSIEKVLFQAVIDQFVKQLLESGGQITSQKTELKLSEAVDRIVNEFQRVHLQEINKTIASDFANLFQLNATYFQGLYPSTSKGNRFNEIKKQVRAEMRRRLGLNDRGQVVTGGYLDRLIKNVPVREQIKQETFKAVMSGQRFSDFQNTLRQVIQGTKEVDGSLVKYYKTFAYDTYQQFDRATNKAFGKRLGLQQFVYAGGLIENSRDFCIDKNDKIFTVEEAQKWKDDPDLPRTKAEKASGTVTNYDPLIDMGRWWCRHMARFISDQLAARIRDEEKLKAFKDPEKVEKEFPRQKNLSASDQKVQEAAIKHYIKNREKLIQDYIKDNGVVSDTDLARNYFKEVGYNGLNASAVHEAASALNKDVARTLTSKGSKGRVVMYAGGAGSGKTSAIEKMFKNVKSDTDVIIDGNMAAYESSAQKIDTYISSGRKTSVIYVYRDPEDAWVNGVISRMKNPKSGGRIVPLSTFLENTLGSYNTIDRLMKRTDHRGLTITLVDNSLGYGNQAEMSARKFQSIRFPSNLKQHLLQVTKDLLEKGLISQKQYEALIL